MTTTQAAICISIPGYAELLENKANCEGNLGWHGIAKKIKYTRNSLFAGVALTAIGVVGLTKKSPIKFDPVTPFGVRTISLRSNFSTRKSGKFGAIATLGIGISALSAKEQYETASLILGVIKSQKEMNSMLEKAIKSRQDS